MTCANFFDDFIEIIYGQVQKCIDFKTSSKLKDESWIKGYFMQCSAYAVMYEERTGIPVSQIVIMIAVDSEHPQVFIKKRND